MPNPTMKPVAQQFRGTGGAMKPVTQQYRASSGTGWLGGDWWSRPTEADLERIAQIAGTKVGRARDLVYDGLSMQGANPDEEEEYRLIAEIHDRKTSMEMEQTRLRAMFRRMDNLFYPDAITTGGADHWPEGVKAGRVHVSLNTPQVYVEIPASLIAHEPVENYIPSTSEVEDRAKAARAERLYFEWKDNDDFEMKCHRALVVRGLYGHTFGKVYWDSLEKRPTVSVIEDPENLYVGWGNSEYTRMDWALYCYGLSPQAVREDWGLDVLGLEDAKGSYFPFVTSGDHADPIGNVFGVDNQRNVRPRPDYETGQVEVYDYWYKKPKGKGKRPDIWNCIFVGNKLVKNKKHPEYEELPYVPLPNTFIPGLPYGRPELYDLEQLFREKDERITNAGQMIASITDGQRWQLVGPEAPDEVPPNAVPTANKMAAPGPGNEIKALQPFVSQYAVEDYLKRLDHEMENVSGLNELLLGRAPATILGSSKAIAALVANYEARIKGKRDIYYSWRKRVWKMAAKIWEAKDSKVSAIIDGQYRIDVSPPELTPRDELENSQRAMSLVQNRLWTMERAMDATGVEDPADEKNLIREEQTDAALNPAAVQTQATLLGTLQALGIKPPEASVSQAQNAQRSLNRPTPGGQSLNAPENQGNPPGESLPTNAQAPNGAPQGTKAMAQSMLQEGESSGRILTQTPLGGGTP